jgi:hypothetical protein
MEFRTSEWLLSVTPSYWVISLSSGKALISWKNIWAIIKKTNWMIAILIRILSNVFISNAPVKIFYSIIGAFPGIYSF